MINFASKCLKITLTVINLKFSIQNQKNKICQKNQVDGDTHVKFMPGVNPPPPTVHETLPNIHISETVHFLTET
jgi:hypothetical protein